MAETTQFVSRISVKDLISAFENKSETVRVEFSRPRARSFGNVLNKNVIVRLSEFTTLEDIEKGLTKLETDLNFYEVYNKAKHVAFQEQFFNILTSIANIDNNDGDAPARKKRLISRTQTLVSFLNQKLPTNISQVVESKPANQHKYTTYAEHVKATKSSEIDSAETQLNDDSKVQPTLYVDSSSAVDVTDSGAQYVVSVKKLKENFQNKTETDGTPKQERTVKVEQKVVVTKHVENTERTKSVVTITKGIQNTEQPKPVVTKQTEKQPIESKSVIEEKVESVSVTKLRSLFEQRSTSKGLEVITVDKPQLAKNDFGGSAQNISSIPYTERNLGTFRLQRSVSGNYMNYSGLLKRVDINRSSSVLELNPSNVRSVVEDSSDDSGAESDDTLENEDEDDVRIEEISSLSEDNPETIENGKVHIIEDSEDIHAKYSSNIEQEDNNNETEHNVPNGVATFVSENESQPNSLDVEKENLSNLQGYQEETVNYSEARIEHTESDDSNETDEESTFHGVDEVEVNSGIADSKNVREEENVATLEVAEGVSQSEVTSENIKEVENSKTTENELSFRGYDEQEVNQGTAVSQNVQTEENVAKLEATSQDISQSSFISEAETNNLNDNQPEGNVNETELNDSHVIEETADYDDEHSQYNSSIFSSLHELEDERDRSLIEEVIEKIDVEQTLANADLEVNPEDLKNADDEFEKLLENSQSGK